MRRSRLVIASALLGLLLGLQTSLLVVPAGAAFGSGGKAPSDQSTYSYDSPSASTTPTHDTRTNGLIGRSAPEAWSGVVHLGSGNDSAGRVPGDLVG